MYYASVGVISLIVLVIINMVALKKVEKSSANDVRLKYRQYLISLIVFFAADILWGIFYEQRWLILTYIDTFLFFLTMVVSVLLWTRAVVAFSEDTGKTGKLLVMCGWGVFSFELIVLIVNLFVPIVFTFGEDREYIPHVKRTIIEWFEKYNVKYCISEYPHERIK